ncbi:DUF805 domain-containing protein [Ligilactobacillus salivarius]|uniref:DUF805 domain-containing protein n=1 Tax=Ligilactobacillus salivarius TaxID=1624 RepID=UPI0009DB6A20|nr:DUF805 domain-containing protein [Ligilactobacillus salivarius]ATP36083.1 DUF805 domain-containing protein [Ligilactobacillus salivarius]OQR02949.1 hypothetical protein B6U48_04475 [Ligilactobacillus salivarius]OQR04893.1 hypothetical protein B6U49_04640 [Ligilactobacillus salivarius]
MFCTKCGLKNPVDAIFCYKCGNKLFVGENTDFIESGDNFLIDFWTNIINFDGKMNKHSFWAAVLTLSIVNIIIVALLYDTNGMLLWYLYDLFFIIATLSASVRRLHDMNRSGAYILLNLIPFVGQVVLLVMLLQENEMNKNKKIDDPINSMDNNSFYLLIGIFVVICIIACILSKLNF